MDSLVLFMSSNPNNVLKLYEDVMLNQQYTHHRPSICKIVYVDQFDRSLKLDFHSSILLVFNCLLQIFVKENQKNKSNPIFAPD